MNVDQLALVLTRHVDVDVEAAGFVARKDVVELVDGLLHRPLVDEEDGYVFSTFTACKTSKADIADVFGSLMPFVMASAHLPVCEECYDTGA